MKSRTSFINRGILKNDFKRFSWIGIVYLLALLCCIPLKILMTYSRPEEVKQYYDEFTYVTMFTFDSTALQMMLLLIVPVLTGILLFRYLQTNNASNMQHALPIKRVTLYNTHVLAGIIFLSLPLLITAVVSWLLLAGLGIDSVSILTILSWFSISLLFNLLLFMTSVFVGMFTGMSVLQGILSYILLLLPSGLSMLLIEFMQVYTFGFAGNYYSSSIGNWSPLIKLVSLSNSSLQLGEIITYILVIILFFFIGAFFYPRRHLETAGNAVAFEVLRPIFKYGVTFCSMLLIGTYFYHSQDSITWTYFGYFLGAIITYFFMEILLNKSLYIFNRKTFRDFGIYGLAVILLIRMMQFDITGYEKRIPQLSQVESIYMDHSFYPLINQQTLPDYRQQELPVIFHEKDNMERIYALHHSIVKNREKNKQIPRTGYNKHLEHISLAYELKDGSYICRNYTIDQTEYAQQLKLIYESAEYKKLHYSVLRVSPAQVNSIEMTVNEVNKELRITDPVQIQQALAALHEDIGAESYEEMVINNKSPWGNISILLKNEKRVDIQWQKHYSTYTEWLKSIGKYEQARIMPGDIAYAVIGTLNDWEKGRYDPEELINQAGALKITDPQKLEWYLQNYEEGYSQYEQRPKYSIIFVIKKDGGMINGFIPADIAPQYVTQHFSQVN